MGGWHWIRNSLSPSRWLISSSVRSAVQMVGVAGGGPERGLEVSGAEAGDRGGVALGDPGEHRFPIPLKRSARAESTLGF